MPRRTAYVYFHDKIALYNALFRQGYEQYAATISQAMVEAPVGWEGLRTISEAYFQFCLDNPELFTVVAY